MTYEAPGVLSSSVGGSQVFTFNASPLGVNATITWAGVGTFNNAKMLVADKYGGAGGTQYLQVPASATMTLNLTTPQSYFGFWWSAGDSLNALTFKLGATVVTKFNASILNSFLSSSYNGMPSGPFAGQNSSEKYAFINFYGINGATFDTVIASQGSSKAFESDNWTVATSYTTPLSGTPLINYTTTPSGAILTNVVIASNSSLSNDTVTAASLTVTPSSTLTGNGTLTATLTNQGQVIMNSMTINGDVNNSGTISGSGTITGNTTNSGVINGSGLTINGGVTNSGTITGSGTINGNTTNTGVINGSGLTINGGVTNSGIISGTGSINGNTTNSGVINISGVTINGGVSNSGTIIGPGTINGSTTNSGTISTGPSGGATTINGNLTQTTNGQTVINVQSATNYGSVVVNGSAIINGTIVISPVSTNSLNYGDQYNVITATGGISGSNSVVAPQGFRGREVINSTNETILIAPQSYTQVAQTPNQLQVAKALDSFITSPNPDNQVVSTALDRLTAAQYPSAFNAIAPTIYQSVATIAFNAANALNSGLVQRLWGLRVAGTGFSMSGFADNTPVYQDPQSSSDGKDFKNPVSPKDYKQPVSARKDFISPCDDNHWGMFVDGNGLFAQANSANMLPKYNSQSGGVSTGLTYKWNKCFGTGIYSGYEGSYARYGGGNRLIDNAVLFGIFGTYGQSNGMGFYADALAGGGYHNYNVTRNIAFSTINRTASSAPGAGELDALIAGGYDLKRGNWTFGPQASLQYTYLRVNQLNETGAQSLDFNSAGWNSSSMLSTLGLTGAYSWQANRHLIVVPQLSMSWQHEFMQNPYAINGSMGGSPAFSNWSAAPTRDFLYTGVGFTIEFSKKWNTSLFYNAAAGNQNLVSQNIFWSAGVKF